MLCLFSLYIYIYGCIYIYIYRYILYNDIYIYICDIYIYIYIYVIYIYIIYHTSILGGSSYFRSLRTVLRILALRCLDRDMYCSTSTGSICKQSTTTYCWSSDIKSMLARDLHLNELHCLFWFKLLGFFGPPPPPTPKGYTL